MSTRDQGEKGYVAAELALGLGLLVFPVALLVLTLPTWTERQATARTIAREAARTVAMGGVCETAKAEQVSATIAENLGVHDGAVTIRLDCVPGSRLERGGDVTASVTVAMPAVDIPGIVTVEAWSWTADHTEPVDRYRSL